jgi:hypothetical protein
MSGAVYLLYAATSLACAALLFRGYRRNGPRLLLWSSLCFLGLTLDNVFLFIDLFLLPQIDLSTWRSLPAVIGLTALLYGLIWDAR